MTLAIDKTSGKVIGQLVSDPCRYLLPSEVRILTRENGRVVYRTVSAASVRLEKAS